MKQIEINKQVLNEMIELLAWMDDIPNCVKMSICERLWEQVQEMWNDETDNPADEFEIKDGQLFAMIDGEDFMVVGK